MKTLALFKTAAKTAGKSAVWLSLVLAAQPVHAGDKISEIHVSLFGQPCLLDGPFTQAELKSIHAVSPEQLDVGPEQPPSKLKTRIRVALQTFRSNTLPTQLSRYKESYQKRLQAQQEFFDALDELKNSKKSDTLLAVGKRNLPARAYKTFEVQVKKLDATPSAESLDQLFETYNGGVEAEPEEEFHRGILAANVHYSCSFEDHSE